MKLIDAHYMRILCQLVESVMPKGYGFTVIVFPFYKKGPANRAHYITTASRESMLSALKEAIEQIEKGQDTGSFEPN